MICHDDVLGMRIRRPHGVTPSVKLNLKYVLTREGLTNNNLKYDKAAFMSNQVRANLRNV